MVLQKVPQPQSTLLLRVASVALGSPRESQGGSCAFFLGPMLPSKGQWPF